MAEALRPLLARYFDQGMQLVFVADEDLHGLVRRIVAECSAQRRIVACGFDVELHRLG